MANPTIKNTCTVCEHVFTNAKRDLVMGVAIDRLICKNQKACAQRAEENASVITNVANAAPNQIIHAVILGTKAAKAAKVRQTAPRPGTKSALILAVYANDGMDIARVASELGIRYQQVYNTLRRYKRASHPADTL